MADTIKIPFEVNVGEIKAAIGEIEKLNQTLETNVKLKKQAATSTDEEKEAMRQLREEEKKARAEQRMAAEQRKEEARQARENAKEAMRLEKAKAREAELASKAAAKAAAAEEKAARAAAKAADQAAKDAARQAREAKKLAREAELLALAQHKLAERTQKASFEFSQFEGAAGALGGKMGEVAGKLTEASGNIQTLSSAFSGAGGVAGALATTVGLVVVALAAATFTAGQTAAKLKELQTQYNLSAEGANALYISAQGISAATGGEISEIAKQLNILQKTFFTTAEEAEAALLLMKEKMGESAEDGVEWIQEYSANLRDLGFSLTDAANLTIQSKQAGIYDDKVLDSIQEFRLRVNTLSTEQQALVDSNTSLSETLEKLRSGAINGKQALAEIAPALRRMQEEGKDVTPIFDALFGGASESAREFLLAMDSVIGKEQEVSKATQELQKSGEQLAESQIRAAQLLGFTVDEVGKIAETVMNRLGAVFLEIFNGIVSVIRLAGVGLEAIGKAIVALFTEGASASETFQKVWASGLAKIREDASVKAQATSTEAATGTGTAAAGGGSTGGGTTVSASSPAKAATKAVKEAERGDTEAVKRLELQKQNEMQALEKARAQELISTEQFNLNRAELELKYIALSESLAKELYTTQPAKFRKRKAEEERDFQVQYDAQRFDAELAFIELSNKLKEAEVKDETARAAQLIELTTQFYDRRIAETTAANKRINLNASTASYDAIQIELRKVEKIIAIQEAFEAQMLEMGEEVPKKSLESRQKYDDLVIQQTELLNDRVAELNAEREKKATEATDRSLGNITSSFTAINENLAGVGEAFSAITDIQGIDKEIAGVNAELEKLPEGSEAAAALQEKLDGLNAEKALTAFTALAGAVSGVIGAINDIQQAAAEQEIERLDAQIEKQNELIEVKREQLDQEREEMEMKREFEDALVEQRDSELEYLSEQLPEAEAARLEQQIMLDEKEREAARLAEDKELARKEANLVKEEQKKKQMEDKKRVIQAKAFESERAANIAQIVIQGAVAFATTLATVPFPLGAILAPIQLGLAIAQIASVASQPNPYKQKLAKGTLSVAGGIPGVDSVDALLMPGEAVIPTSLATKYRPILEDIYHDRLDLRLLRDLATGISGGVSEKKAIMEQNKKMDKLIHAVENIQTNMIVDEEGFTVFQAKLSRQHEAKNKKLYKS